jgi:hypothetical protein
MGMQAQSGGRSAGRCAGGLADVEAVTAAWVSLWVSADSRLGRISVAEYESGYHAQRTGHPVGDR